MKFIIGIAVIFTAGILALLAMGYSLHIEEYNFEVIGPTQISPYDAEAEANSPECMGLKDRYPEKDIYTSEELEERSKATMACINAKKQYIKAKR